MIFLLSALASAGDFDHSYAELDAVYEGAVFADGIDYRVLASHRKGLDATIAQVAHADPSTFDHDQKLALYVNAYNAYTLATVLDAMPIGSILEIDGGKLWDTRKFEVGGAEYTLNELENTRIRKLGDGRIHAAVNCASKGCPPLPADPLRAKTLDAQLTAAATAWVATNAFVEEGTTVKVSKVFEWYADDFTPYVKADLPGVEGRDEATLSFLSQFADEATRKKLTSGRVQVGWTEYDWNLNAH